MPPEEQQPIWVHFETIRVVLHDMHFKLPEKEHHVGSNFYFLQMYFDKLYKEYVNDQQPEDNT